MAIKHTKRKVAPKKDSATASDVVVVGNYKTGQLEWIKKNGVYNWPVREDDGRAGCPQPADFARIRELWLYANVKAERYVFTAQFVGKMIKTEFGVVYAGFSLQAA